MQTYRCYSFWLLLWFAQVCRAGYGDTENGHPNAQERELYQRINWMRSNPPGYATNVMGVRGILNKSPARPAFHGKVPYEASVELVSRMIASSNNLGTIQTGTKDGVFLYFGTQAYNTQNANVTFNNWICGNQASGACIPDNTNPETNQRILNRNFFPSGTYQSVGCSYRREGEHYWACHMAREKTTRSIIASGYHLSGELKTVFMASYMDTNVEGVNARIFIKGRGEQQMTSEGNGLFKYETDTTDSCIEYYFRFSVSARESLYPETQYLQSGPCDAVPVGTHETSTIPVPTAPSTTSMAPPSSTTSMPTPSSSTSMPTPSSTTSEPTPSSTTSKPTPSSTTSKPTPSSTTSKPTPSSTTSKETSSSTTPSTSKEETKPEKDDSKEPSGVSRNFIYSECLLLAFCLITHLLMK